MISLCLDKYNEMRPKIHFFAHIDLLTWRRTVSEQLKRVNIKSNLFACARLVFLHLYHFVNTSMSTILIICIQIFLPALTEAGLLSIAWLCNVRFAIHWYLALCMSSTYSWNGLNQREPLGKLTIRLETFRTTEPFKKRQVIVICWSLLSFEVAFATQWRYPEFWLENSNSDGSSTNRRGVEYLPKKEKSHHER